MKQARWGLLFVLAMVVGMGAGCKSFPVLLVKRSNYDRLRNVDELNTNLNKRINALIEEMDKIANELESAQRLQNAASKQAAEATAEAAGMRSDLASLTNELVGLGAKSKTLEAEMVDLRSKKPEPREDVSIDINIDGVEVVRNPLLGGGIRLPNHLLFESGKATLKVESHKIMKQVAQIPQIRNPKNFLRICGFSDSTPIVHSTWGDNFQLSGERARAVLEALKAAGINPARMHFAGFGEHMLVMEDGKENKERSRRVEIYAVVPVK